MDSPQPPPADSAKLPDGASDTFVFPSSLVSCGLSPALNSTPQPADQDPKRKSDPARLKRTTSSSRPETLQTFHLFPKLPPELRHLIFTLALSVPRVVTISYSAAKTYTYTLSPPSLLATTSEARCIALKTHLLLPLIKPRPKNKDTNHENKESPTTHPLYFNPQTYILYPKIAADAIATKFLRYLPLSTKAKIEKVVIHGSYFRKLKRPHMVHWKPMILQFPHLKVVVVVDRYEDGCLHGNKRMKGALSARGAKKVRFYVDRFLRGREILWGNVEWDVPRFVYRGLCREDR